MHVFILPIIVILSLCAGFEITTSEPADEPVQEPVAIEQAVEASADAQVSTDVIVVSSEQE